jgi:hypothetical protein
VQEGRKQLATVSVHDLLELPELLTVVRFSVTEGRDQQRDAVRGSGVDGRTSDIMDKLPESRRPELEDRERQIDGGVIVHQPPRHDPEQRSCNRQLADRGRSMEKKQLHAPSVSRVSPECEGWKHLIAPRRYLIFREEVCRVV